MALCEAPVRRKGTSWIALPARRRLRCFGLPLLLMLAGAALWWHESQWRPACPLTLCRDSRLPGAVILKAPMLVQELRLSPDGRRLACLVPHPRRRRRFSSVLGVAGHWLCCWDLQRNALRWQSYERGWQPGRLDMDPEGRALLTEETLPLTWTDNRLRTRARSSFDGAALPRWPLEDVVSSRGTLSPDGSLLAWRVGSTGVIRLRGVHATPTGPRPCEVLRAGRATWFQRIAVSPDNTRVAAVSTWGGPSARLYLVVWDSRTGRRLVDGRQPVPGNAHDWERNPLYFAGEHQTLICDTTVFDVDHPAGSPKPIAPLAGRVPLGPYSPDGGLGLFGAPTLDRIEAWDFRAGRVVRSWPGFRFDDKPWMLPPERRAAFSLQRKLLAYIDRDDRVVVRRLE